MTKARRSKFKIGERLKVRMMDAPSVYFVRPTPRQTNSSDCVYWRDSYLSEVTIHNMFLEKANEEKKN